MRKKAIVFMSAMFLLLSLLFGAQGKALVEPDVSFSFGFTKPTHDEFGFCEPGMPDVPFSGGKNGLQFPFHSNDAALGYPSTTSIGIYYSLQSACRVTVWCNADPRHIDSKARMRLLNSDGTQDMNDGNMLNYIIEVTGDPGDKVPQSQVGLGYSESSLADPSLPVYQVFHDGVGTRKGNATLKLTLTSPNRDALGNVMPYMEGQYMGYIIMQYYAL